MASLRFVCFAIVLSALLLAQSNPTPQINRPSTLPVAPSALTGHPQASPETGSQLFQKAHVYGSGGTAAMSVAAADLNGDGVPDLVVANQNGEGEGNVGVLLGNPNGNGTFQHVFTYDSGGDHGWAVAVADLNADGKPDIVVLNTFQSYTVGVLLGNGDGTFSRAVTYKAGGSAIAIADVNGDGIPDLITSGVGVLLGNGDGTFKPVVYYGSVGGYALALADVNGDGKLDAVVSDLFGNTGGVGVLLGNGDGTFQSEAIYASGGIQSYSVAVGDVNGDGKPDIAISNYCTNGSCVGDGTAAVLLGNGDGTFQPATTYDSGGRFATAVALADLNGDGKLDLLVGNSGAASGVLLGNGDGTFQPLQSVFAGPTESITAVDVNGGLPDLLVAGGGGDVFALLAMPEPLVSILSASPSPAHIGQTVTLTATLTPPSGRILDGRTVTFLANGAKIGTANTANGIATLTTSFSTKGKHKIKSKIPRSSAFPASTGSVTLVVNP